MVDLGFWQWLGVGWGVMAVAMAALWLHAVAIRNASFVDVGWAAGMGAMALLFGFGAAENGAHGAIVGVLGAAWAWRLAWHLYKRLAGEPEDGRYQRMRAAMGAKANAGFFAFFQAQAIFTVIFSVPFLVAAQSPVEGLQAWDFLGILVWIIAVGGETIADRQLDRWRRDPANKGKTCRAGLWGWSRHPNYFFEWTHWFAYVLLAFGSPIWWASFWGPVVMLVFLFKVTGIPWTEARALESRGEDYRRYQREVSVFFPLPPKRA